MILGFWPNTVITVREYIRAQVAILLVLLILWSWVSYILNTYNKTSKAGIIFFLVTFSDKLIGWSGCGCTSTNICHDENVTNLLLWPLISHSCFNFNLQVAKQNIFRWLTFYKIVVDILWYVNCSTLCNLVKQLHEYSNSKCERFLYA